MERDANSESSTVMIQDALNEIHMLLSALEMKAKSGEVFSDRSEAETYCTGQEELLSHQETNLRPPAADEDIYPGN